jgi:hypothetical protein
MDGALKFSSSEQFAALRILTVLTELFEMSPRPSFSREEVVAIIGCVWADEEIFDRDVVIAHELEMLAETEAS